MADDALRIPPADHRTGSSLFPYYADPPGGTAARRVLLVTAVPAERDAVVHAFDGPRCDIPLPGGTLHRIRRHTATIDVLAGGVGAPATAAAVSTALAVAALTASAYDLVLCAGIGGGFQPEVPVGSLVVADELVAADLGVETAEGFLSLADLGLAKVSHRPDLDLVRKVASVTGACLGSVLTVSTMTGSERRAAELRAAHPGALAEAMEGFGVAEAGAAADCPVLEIRAVSNPVGTRDRSAWRVPEALATLTGAFERLAPVLNQLAAQAALTRR